MEELHIDSINRGHEASYGLGHVPGRGRTPTKIHAKSRPKIKRVIRAV
jgi:hypothetical protein